MNYYSYDLPSAVTEEGLANIVYASVYESVKNYLSGVTAYVARCHAQDAEKQETIDALHETVDMLTSDKSELMQQVEELKECLATCHAMRSQAMNFNGVGTVVAHADQVTLQYQAS
jgi:predicted RNase H-like nuclease (RuvC/YqgF family)